MSALRTKQRKLTHKGFLSSKFEHGSLEVRAKTCGLNFASVRCKPFLDFAEGFCKQPGHLGIFPVCDPSGRAGYAHRRQQPWARRPCSTTKEKGEDDIEGDTMVNNRTGGKKAQTARLPKPPRKHSCYHGAVLCPAISAPGVEIAGGVLRGTLSILRGQAAPRRGLPACGAACACRHPSRLRGSLGPAEEGNLGLVLQI